MTGQLELQTLGSKSGQSEREQEETPQELEGGRRWAHR